MTPRSAPAVAVILLSLGSSSCGLISFDVEQAIEEQSVPGSPLGGLLPANPILQIPLKVDIEAQTQAMGTGPAKAAYLKCVRLIITAPPTADWSFLDSIVIHVRANGQPDREVARLVPVPADKTIQLRAVPDINLLPYVKAGATLTATASGRVPSQDITYRGIVIVTIKV